MQIQVALTLQGYSFITSFHVFVLNCGLFCVPQPHLFHKDPRKSSRTFSRKAKAPDYSETTPRSLVSCIFALSCSFLLTWFSGWLPRWFRCSCSLQTPEPWETGICSAIRDLSPSAKSPSVLVYNREIKALPSIAMILNNLDFFLAVPGFPWNLGGA